MIKQKFSVYLVVEYETDSPSRKITEAKVKSQINKRLQRNWSLLDGLPVAGKAQVRVTECIESFQLS